ncbi:MAG: plasmid pRiA4b ORF-3 family protein, partial [Pseudonocardiales bacterium]
WRHLAARLPDARSEPERHAGVVYLLSVAAGRREDDLLLAEGMTILGWMERRRRRRLGPTGRTTTCTSSTWTACSTATSRRSRAAPRGDEESFAVGDAADAVAEFSYEYDFGDGSEHDIHVGQVIAGVGSAAPRVVGGARACPPEDCGGTWGYEHLLEVLSDPTDDEHYHLLQLGGWELGSGRLRSGRHQREPRALRPAHPTTPRSAMTGVQGRR